MKKISILYCLLNLLYSNLIFSQIKIELTHAMYKDSISLSINNISDHKIYLFLDKPIYSLPIEYKYHRTKEISSLNYTIFKKDSVIKCDLLIDPTLINKIMYNTIGIIINPNEYIYSNVFSKLPFIDCFSKKEHYDIQLYFKQDAKFVKKRLSKKEIKYLKQNNIKIFDGIIYSNKIPLIVKFGEIEN